jgi:hypothetical protein
VGRGGVTAGRLRVYCFGVTVEKSFDTVLLTVPVVSVPSGR